MKIIKVKYLSGYRLEVVFENEQIVITDFEEFLSQAKNPMTLQFKNIEKFKKVKIKFGHLTWQDGQMDISAESILNKEFSLK